MAASNGRSARVIIRQALSRVSRGGGLGSRINRRFAEVDGVAQLHPFDHLIAFDLTTLSKVEAFLRQAVNALSFQ